MSTLFCAQEALEGVSGSGSPLSQTIGSDDSRNWKVFSYLASVLSEKGQSQARSLESFSLREFQAQIQIVRCRKADLGPEVLPQRRLWPHLRTRRHLTAVLRTALQPQHRSG